MDKDEEKVTEILDDFFKWQDSSEGGLIISAIQESRVLAMCAGSISGIVAEHCKKSKLFKGKDGEQTATALYLFIFAAYLVNKRGQIVL